MPRLINANALKKEFPKDEDWEYPVNTNRLVCETIDAQPTIDAVPVRHGKWREYPISDGMNQCSKCGVLRFGKSNYCPNCGARMDAEGREE